MEMEITLPDQVPVMTLPNTAFFPQALMPLHIYEPRYRHMLRDVLATNRLFAVAGMDVSQLNEPGSFEPPFRVATVGMIRACQKNENGTSNLLLQGLSRIEILAITRDEPYRCIRIRALTSKAGGSPEAIEALRRTVARLIRVKVKLASAEAEGMAAFLQTIDDPEAFVDIAAFNLCDDAALKQRLLETLDVHRRLRLFSQRLRKDIGEIRLRRKLQGPLADDRISHN